MLLTGIAFTLRSILFSKPLQHVAGADLDPDAHALVDQLASPPA